MNAILDSHLDPEDKPGLDNFAVGYHFGIDALGNIYEGRPIWIRGSHVLADSSGRGNTGRLGIEVFGNFHIDRNVPTQSQIDSTVALINGLGQDGYQLQFLGGHRDFNPLETKCPGDNFMEGGYLEDIAERTNLTLVNFN